MKVYTIQNDGCFKIHLSSESQEESSILMEMSSSVRSPVESYGYVEKKETWAWFFLPLRKGMEWKAIKFGNKIVGD